MNKRFCLFHPSSFILHPFLEGHSAQASHLVAGAQLQQALDGGLDEVDGVGTSVHLGQDVADAADLKHVADAAAGLDAGAGAGGHHDDAAGAVLADDAVRDGVALQRDPLLALERLLGVLGGLVDCGRDLVGLAVAGGDAAVVVADDDQGVKAEAAAALDDGGAAPDLDDPVFQSVLARLSVTISGHAGFPQSGGPGERPGRRVTGSAVASGTSRSSRAFPSWPFPSWPRPASRPAVRAGSWAAFSARCTSVRRRWRPRPGP